MTFYPLESQEFLITATTLCPAEERILNYLKTLNPFSSPKFHITVEYLADELEYHCDTILRCLRNLRSYGLVAYHMYRRTLYSFEISPPVQSDKQAESQPKQEQLSQSGVDDDRLKRSKDRFKRSVDRLKKNEDPSTAEVSADRPVTNNRGLNFKPNIGGTPAVDQGGIGQILGTVEAIGIRANQTIQTTIHRLHQEFGAAAAARRVDLAIEALREQSEKGRVRNPGGFLNAALARCFTPNDDGYRERKSKEKNAAPQAAPGRSPAPALTSSSSAGSFPALAVPPALDLVQLQQQCDPLMLTGQQSLVAERLQEKIAKGNLNAIRSLLRMRSDWGFRLENNQIINSPLQT